MEELTKLKMKQYRKMIGKFNWLAQSTRPDLCYMSLNMATKNNVATISDLRNINFVLKKVKERPSQMFFTRIGNKENLEVIGIGDASYKCDEKSVGGDLIFIKEVNSSGASLVYCKTKQIQKLLTSPKMTKPLMPQSWWMTRYIS